MTIEELFGTLQMSVVATWRKHLRSAKYGKHMALDEFYKEMPDKVDDLIEAYMGAYGKKIGAFQNILSSSNMNTLKYLQELKRVCKEGYALMGENEELKGLMDDIVNQINSTLYKVKELSESSMMDLSDFINEALVNEAKIKNVKTTVDNYVAWYFNVDSIDDIQLSDFESTDFDPDSLENEFKNTYAEQLKYLKQHKNEKIVVKQIDSSMNDIEAEFVVNGITFNTVSTDIFTGK